MDLGHLGSPMPSRQLGPRDCRGCVWKVWLSPALSSYATCCSRVGAVGSAAGRWEPGATQRILTASSEVWPGPGLYPIGWPLRSSAHPNQASWSLWGYITTPSVTLSGLPGPGPRLTAPVPGSWLMLRDLSPGPGRGWEDPLQTRQGPLLPPALPCRVRVPALGFISCASLEWLCCSRPHAGSDSTWLLVGVSWDRWPGPRGQLPLT